MKKNYKWVWCLMGALAFTMAGCATHHDHYESQGGYNGTYQQQGNDYYHNNQNPTYWEQQTAPTGAPYEWQHPSPRPQMEP